MSTARRLTTQQVSYLRFKVNYNDTGIATGAGNGKQTLPKGAIVTGTDVYVSAAFNAGTTNVFEVGSATGTTNNADLVGSSFNEAATGLTQNIAPTGAMLGPLAADTQVFAVYTQTGTAATAGAAYVIIKYVIDNDLNVGA